MSDRAASILARLQNKAKETNRSFQLCLQLFCQEELLRRIENSKYVDNLVLKGGLLIYTLTRFDSRATYDIDFLLRNIPNTPEKIVEIINQIINIDTGNNYITFEITRVENISVTNKYTGISIGMIAHIKNTKTPLGIDFGFGDIIVPNQVKRQIPTQLTDFISPVVNTYSLESTLAEKLDAILLLMEFSSRMKDYYDIYYLAHIINFDGATLQDAIHKTFKNLFISNELFTF